ncbi:MAG TPA: DNA primase large subunit PriL [Methanomassiliicoccaceae archaeon]|nr:DNA primase large subunit PriL [Methanomassiliicoccaceae archaeon]
MDPLSFAKFPFLRDAVEYVKDQGVTLEDLLTHQAYQLARARGKARVIDALEHGVIQLRPMATEGDRLEEILSYPVARIFVSGVNERFLTKRYALAEAVTMYERLEREELDVVEEVAYQLDVAASRHDESLRMHFSDYLRYTSRLRSKDWKLVNTEVKGGYVSLPQLRFARVLQQALQDKLESELPLPVDEAILQPLQSDIRELKERTAIMREQYKAEDFGAVSVDNFPPCMKHFIGMAQAGENLPHSARFALVSFLHHIGLSSDEILNLFAVSPDFDASKTRYQIDHITGESSGVEYTPPECTTMKSYGNCVEPDSLCNNPKAKVKHPLTYYRIKNRPMKAPKGGPSSRSSAPSGQR